MLNMRRKKDPFFRRCFLRGFVPARRGSFDSAQDRLFCFGKRTQNHWRPGVAPRGCLCLSCHPRQLSSGIQGFCFFLIPKNKDSGFPLKTCGNDRKRNDRGAATPEGAGHDQIGASLGMTVSASFASRSGAGVRSLLNESCLLTIVAVSARFPSGTSRCGCSRCR